MRLYIYIYIQGPKQQTPDHGWQQGAFKQSHEFTGSCIRHLMTDRATGSFVTAVAACMTPRLLVMASFSICTGYGTTTGTGAGCLRSLFFPMSLDSHVSNNSNASMRSLSMRRRVPQALTKRQVHNGPWLGLWVIHHLLFLSSL